MFMEKLPEEIELVFRMELDESDISFMLDSDETDKIIGFFQYESSQIVSKCHINGINYGSINYCNVQYKYDLIVGHNWSMITISKKDLMLIKTADMIIISHDGDNFKWNVK